MKILKINPKKISQEEIDLIVDYFNNGKTVVLPTDTIYAIHAIATNQKAVERIFKAKGRGKEKPMLILVKSWCMVKEYCFVSAKQDRYLRTLWPGPISVILKKRDGIPDVVTAGNDSVAVRMPDNDLLISIIKKINLPLVSTSVNKSGQASLSDVNEIKNHFNENEIDLVVDIGKNKNKKPSRLIDARDVENIKILRK